MQSLPLPQILNMINLTMFSFWFGDLTKKSSVLLLMDNTPPVQSHGTADWSIIHSIRRQKDGGQKIQKKKKEKNKEEEQIYVGV